MPDPTIESWRDALLATVENLRGYLAAERDSEIKTRGQRAAELLAEIETLRK